MKESKRTKQRANVLRCMNRKEKVEKTARTKWEEADWKRKRKQEREKSKE